MAKKPDHHKRESRSLSKHPKGMKGINATPTVDESRNPSRLDDEEALQSAGGSSGIAVVGLVLCQS